MQADAYACLLDELGIEKAVVFATSGGANSGIRFTARYPERVSALVLLSPAAPGPVVVENPPLAVFNTLLRSEFVYWSMVTYFKPFMQRMVGVPDSLTLTPELEGMVDNLLAKTIPVGGRIDGMISDFTFPPSEFYEETSDTAPYPLRNIETPVLVLNALDDPLAVPENVRGLAEKFPNARLVVFPDGGHPILSHNEEVRAEIAHFLQRIVTVGKTTVNSSRLFLIQPTLYEKDNKNENSDCWFKRHDRVHRNPSFARSGKRDGSTGRADAL